jgi:hypothetical protein
MTMRTHHRSTTFFPWLVSLATRLVAHSLQMPEPLVTSTGALAFARVADVERRAARTLCPVRLLRQLRLLFR